MAAGPFYALEAFKQHGLKCAFGVFNLPASDPTIVGGAGFTVTRSDVGKWLVTLGESYPLLVGIYPSIIYASDDANVTAHGGANISSPNNSFFIYTLSAGADADIGATALCSWIAVFSNTSEIYSVGL